MIRHFAVESESAKPACKRGSGEPLLTTAFGANAIAVANQQHPHEQFRINRWPPVELKNGANSLRIPDRLTKRSIDLRR